tara:strand:+ start:1544 stop:1798 length:255 start_codon:yes stop_codon:yes gene_type:complete
LRHYEGENTMDLDNVTVLEMSPEQWEYFMDDWAKNRAESLVVECDMSADEADETAQYDWDTFSGQEGWTMRDERILMKRERYAA